MWQKTGTLGAAKYVIRQVEEERRKRSNSHFHYFLCLLTFYEVQLNSKYLSMLIETLKRFVENTSNNKVTHFKNLN